jgi:hypothetical protein
VVPRDATDTGLLFEAGTPAFSVTRFGEYDPALLAEASGKKLTHLTHLEDVVLDDGPAGVTFALTILREFGRILNGGSVSRALNVSVKWDGAPAIVFGTDPEDGKFFVATKGAFNKTPKLAKSHKDIDAFWSGGLADKMHVAFDALKTAGPKGVFQGDSLYSRDEIAVQTIDGVMYLTFRPNTITYAVDQNSDLGARIAASEFGIVVHTMYTGKGTLADYHASPVSSSAFSSLRPGRDAVILDASFDDLSGSVTFTAQEQNDFDLAFSEAQDLASINPRVYDALLTEPLHAYLQQFINAQVRQNKSLRPKQLVKEFNLFLIGLRDDELAKRKTEMGKQVVRGNFERLLDIFGDIDRELVNWFALHAAIARTKNIVVRKLGQASKVSSFVQTPTGFKVTGPEGFVAVSHSGKAIKLVDRLEFSRLNFTVPKAW